MNHELRRCGNHYDARLTYLHTRRKWKRVDYRERRDTTEVLHERLNFLMTTPCTFLLTHWGEQDVQECLWRNLVFVTDLADGGDELASEIEGVD